VAAPSTGHPVNNKVFAVENTLKTLIESLGDAVDADSVRDTPKRAAEAYRYLTRGYGLKLSDLVNGALFASDMDEMVIIQDIEIYSLCEHHLLPFFGKCHIAYIPNGTLLGLSKFARIADLFARRLQLQERLTQQIAQSIQEVTGAKGVAVIIEAQHLCMMMRGVEKQSSKMKTSVMLGRFRSDERTRNELLSLLR
jgi:GTP cyclohydrolase IA